MAGNTSRFDSIVVAVSFVVMFSIQYPAVANAAEVDGMTYEQAIRRIPERKIPKFWVGDVTGLSGRFEKIAEGKVSTISISPGGRPMHLVTYGKKEKLGHMLEDM